VPLRDTTLNDAERRAFSLCQEVDEASAQAKYNDGVLELTLLTETDRLCSKGAS
jgi:HSP20 family molecular chaperone IbpA